MHAYVTNRARSTDYLEHSLPCRSPKLDLIVALLHVHAIVHRCLERAKPATALGFPHFCASVQDVLHIREKMRMKR